MATRRLGDIGVYYFGFAPTLTDFLFAGFRLGIAMTWCVQIVVVNQ
jgi:hypothetical protein